MTVYEAWDTKHDICIYNGASRSELINEVADYIYFQNHINEYLIDEEDVTNLNEEALNPIGIKLYQNKAGRN